MTLRLHPHRHLNLRKRLYSVETRMRRAYAREGIENWAMGRLMRRPEDQDEDEDEEALRHAPRLSDRLRPLRSVQVPLISGSLLRSAWFWLASFIAHDKFEPADAFA
jgi:hypothetical protein